MLRSLIPSRRSRRRDTGSIPVALLFTLVAVTAAAGMGTMTVAQVVNVKLARLEARTVALSDTAVSVALEQAIAGGLNTMNLSSGWYSPTDDEGVVIPEESMCWAVEMDTATSDQAMAFGGGRIESIDPDTQQRTSVAGRWRAARLAWERNESRWVVLSWVSGQAPASGCDSTSASGGSNGTPTTPPAPTVSVTVSGASSDQVVAIDGANYRVVAWANTGSLTVEGGNLDIDYLIVGGGGGGGSTANSNDDGGGGGGGGGVIAGSTSITANAYPITVGQGGNGGANGGNSTFIDLTAIGGGRGGVYLIPPTIGGSGGGANWHNGTGAAGTAGQGFPGGNARTGDPYNAGGGGGAGAAGQAGSNTKAGDGGAGVSSSITGVLTVYGGGGGGATRSRVFNSVLSLPGVGGAGGGGNGGAFGGAVNATPGIDGLGGGGGGNRPGGNAIDSTGGDGIVIVRWRV